MKVFPASPQMYLSSTPSCQGSIKSYHSPELALVLSQVPSHLSQQMMTIPSARHMELVVLSKSLSQPGPRDYLELSCKPSFLSCALVTLSTMAAVESAYLINDVCLHPSTLL